MMFMEERTDDESQYTVILLHIDNEVMLDSVARVIQFCRENPTDEILRLMALGMVTNLENKIFKLEEVIDDIEWRMGLRIKERDVTALYSLAEQLEMTVMELNDVRAELEELQLNMKREGRL